MKYYLDMRKKKQFKYILLCSLLILAFNAFWFFACVFGPDTRYYQRYIVSNKCGDEIQQYIEQRMLTNSRSCKFIISKTDTSRNSIVRYENKIVLNDVDLGFRVCIFDDSVFTVRDFCFGKRFKSNHKLQIDSCYCLTDYNIDYEAYKVITHAIENALFGDSIIFKDDTEFYDIPTMKHEVDAKTWYSQRNIWLAVLHNPHLTILIPLIITIIIGLPIIYYKTKSNK